MRRAAWLLLLLLAVAGRAQDAGVPEYYLFPDPADIDETGRPRDPGGRLPVVMVHGFLKDDLTHEQKIHVVFSFLHSHLVKKVNRKLDPFEHVLPLHYRYRPSKPYPELGRDLAKRLKEILGEVPVILLVHSAGALIARYAAEAGLPVLAVVGMAPAHGGSPGASLMFANEAILEADRVDPDHFEVMQRTLAEMGVPLEVSKSLAWDNADGAIAPGEAERFGLEVTSHPPMRYDRYDHYGVLKHFIAPMAGLGDLVHNTEGRKKSDRELEWELMGRYSEKWERSDGVVVPYPPQPEDEEFTVESRTYTGIGHREMFIDRDVLENTWAQVQRVAREALGIDEPAPEEDEVDEGEEPAEPARPPPPQVAQGGEGGDAEGEDLDLGDLDLGELGDELGEDLGEELASDLGEGVGEGPGEDLGEGLGEVPVESARPPPSVMDVAALPPTPRPARPPPPAPDLLRGVDLERVMTSGLVPRWEPEPGAGWLER